MNYKKLGNTDLDVSTICLGTMTWGEQNTQDEGFEQMDYALDQGVNFWDTAEIYSIPPKKKLMEILKKLLEIGLKKLKKETK
jgi:aryl-alcohol dehydrogenase-like predicted oxidoreductase